MVTVTPFSAALGSWGRERTISLCLFITTPMILSCSAVLQKRDLLACLPPLTYCAQMTKAVDDRTAPTTLRCCCPSHFSRLFGRYLFCKERLPAGTEFAVLDLLDDLESGAKAARNKDRAKAKTAAQEVRHRACS